jgi:hypothetical protein
MRRISSGSRTDFDPRSVSNAPDVPVVGITRTKVNYILDADIRLFFDEESREWLERFWNIGSATRASSA